MDEATRQTQLHHADADTPEIDTPLSEVGEGEDPSIVPPVHFPTPIDQPMPDGRTPLLNKLVRHCRRRFRDAKLTDIVVAMFTIVLAIVAFQQYKLTSTSSQESTDQIGQIINASNRIEDAADSFSGSASRINEGVGSAVRALTTQAAEMDRARASSERQSISALDTATKNAQVDARAYIVINMKGQQPSVDCGRPHADAVCTDVQFSNVGRTPAVAVKAEVKLLPFYPMGGHDGIPSGGYDVEADMKKMAANVDDTYSGLEGDVVSVVSPDTAKAYYLDVNGYPCREGYHESVRCSHTVYGIIDYKDIFGTIHETGFCVKFTDTAEVPPQSCRFGNWFDERPNGFPSRKARK